MFNRSTVLMNRKKNMQNLRIQNDILNRNHQEYIESRITGRLRRYNKIKPKPTMKCLPFLNVDIMSESQKEKSAIYLAGCLSKSNSADVVLPPNRIDNESFPSIVNHSMPSTSTTSNANLVDDPIVRDYIIRTQKRIINSKLTTRRRHELPDYIMALSRDILNLIPDNQREMKIIIDFYNGMASVIVKVLSAYVKKDCKQGRIQNTEDFKFLAKKLNSNILLTKLQRKRLADLSLTDNVKQNIEEYIKTYMLKFGKFYKRKVVGI